MRRNAIWLGWVSRESFAPLSIAVRCLRCCSNEYRWTCERIRFWWFTFSFPPAVPLIPIFVVLVSCSCVCCARFEVGLVERSVKYNFMADSKYWSTLGTTWSRMLNPYGWCRMPISPLTLVSACTCGPGLGRSHNGPEDAPEMEGKSFRIGPNFTIIIDLLWITKKWPSTEWKISHFVYGFLFLTSLASSDSTTGLNYSATRMSEENSSTNGQQAGTSSQLCCKTESFKRL